MYDNTLLSLLPEAYEGLESVTAAPSGGCKGGAFNSTACDDGDYFSSCHCGPVYGSKP